MALLFLGQLFAGETGVIQLALHGVKLPDFTVMFSLVLPLLLSEAAFGVNGISDGLQAGVVLRQTDQVFQLFICAAFALVESFRSNALLLIADTNSCSWSMVKIPLDSRNANSSVYRFRFLTFAFCE